MRFICFILVLSVNAQRIKKQSAGNVVMRDLAVAPHLKDLGGNGGQWKGIHHILLSHHYESKLPTRNHQVRALTRRNDETNTGWWIGRMKGGFGFYANLSFTDSYGVVSTWPVLIDTGSSNLAISVPDCSSCGARFATNLNLDVDDTYTIEVSYGDSSTSTSFWKGIRATSDVGFFNSNTGYGDCHAETHLAAITEASTDDGLDEAFFRDGKWYGIWGLAFKGAAASFQADGVYDSPDTFLDVLSDAEVLASKAFTLQYCGTGKARYAYLTVGGYIASQVDSSSGLTFVDVKKQSGTYTYYLTDLNSISVGGVELAFNAYSLNGEVGGALIDSGTTDALVLPESVLGSSVENGTFLNKMYSSYSGSNVNYFQRWLEGEIAVSFDDYKIFKKGLANVNLVIGGIYNLTLTADELSYEFLHQGESYYQISVSSGSKTIIGNVAMGNKVVVFDQENYRVGFGDSQNCGAELSSFAANFSAVNELNDENYDDDSNISFLGISWFFTWVIIGCGTLLVVFLCIYTSSRCTSIFVQKKGEEGGTSMHASIEVGNISPIHQQDEFPLDTFA